VHNVAFRVVPLLRVVVVVVVVVLGLGMTHVKVQEQMALLHCVLVLEGHPQ